MALILDNITLVEYHEIEDRSEYDFAMKYSKQFNKPIDMFDSGDFTELEFGLIKDIQHDLSEGIRWNKLLEYISIITGLDQKNIAKNRILDISQYFAYLRSEVDRINEIEKTLLGHAITGDEDEAGIENFAKFGSYTQLRRLANEDITKLEDVKKIKYSICLMELYYQKTENEFKNELLRIQERKISNNHG